MGFKDWNYRTQMCSAYSKAGECRWVRAGVQELACCKQPATRHAWP